MSRILLTGASGRVGRALIERLASPEFEFALVGRSAESLRQLSDEIHARGGSAHIIEANLSSKTTPETVVQQAATAMGGLDVLIHGAAAYGFQPFAPSSPELLLRVLETSLQSAILLTHAAIPALKLSNNAVVVQIASTAGLRPVTEAVVYSAAKAGMIAFGQALRSEVEGLGIALHTVIPGQLQLQPGGAGLPPAHVAQCIHELILQRAAGCAGSDVILDETPSE